MNKILIICTLVLTIIACGGEPASLPLPENQTQADTSDATSLDVHLPYANRFIAEHITQMLRVGNINIRSILQADNLPTDTIYTVLRADTLQIGGRPADIIIVLAQPKEADCRFCGGHVDLYLFKENQLISVANALNEISSNSTPDVEAFHVRGNHFYHFITGSSGQGYTSGYLEILSISDKSAERVLSIDDYYGDNSGTCDDNTPGDCWSYNSKARYEEGTDLRLVIERNGTIADENNRKAANAAQKTSYIFADGVFCEYQ